MLLDPTAINLNSGSFGPLPRRVFDRVTDLRAALAAEPMDFLLRQAPPLLWNAREHLASFLGGDSRQLVFTANVTAAINLVAASLQLATPGEILLTDHEYGAMHWCWERTARRLGLTLRTFALPLMPSEPAEIVEAARAAMTHRTRLFFFSHVLSPTGMVLPAALLCALARERGVLTAIDGAHAPAYVPIDLNAIGADYYAANCHKWLLAPTGSGFLHCGPGAIDRLLPLQTSWGWHYHRRAAPEERDEFGSTPRLRRLEFEGTRDPCPWLAVPAAIDFQHSLGWHAIRNRIAELTHHTRQRLSELPELRLTTPAHSSLSGAMTAFRLPSGIDADLLRRRLWNLHRIEIAIVERPDSLLLRVSTHFYNEEREVDRLAEALAPIFAQVRKTE